MKPLKVGQSAEAEYHEALTWYRERDARVADRFAAETRRALELIEAFPQIGGRVPGMDDDDVRRMPIHTFPYHVVFVNFPDQLEVIAFAHNRRQPAYFIERLHKT